MNDFLNMQPLKHNHLYIHTFGCQMNVYDSEKIAAQLISSGYQLVSSYEAADLIIVNTCAIREKSQHKVFSLLGRLADLKKKNPGLIIAVGGCVAQQEGQKILESVPVVDIVFGTCAIVRLPQILAQVNIERCRVADVEMSDEIIEFDAPPDGFKASRFVTIMRGCDNYCTYCVVPYVRGKEISRTPERIIDEVKKLVASGVRDITLLGQNVNSYGKKQGFCSFAQLLRRLENTDFNGLPTPRIRFTTSHPKDLSDELIDVFQDSKNICHHIHLPVQSGSDRILKMMNRKYTRKSYIEKIERLRQICPDIAITSDFIVGFPGENNEDFKMTLDLIKKIEYDGGYAFRYSDRPNAPAVRFSDKIPENEKQERLKALLELQEKYTNLKNQALIGKDEWILVDGFSKKQMMNAECGMMKQDIHHSSFPSFQQWTGRTSTNKVVNFINPDSPDEYLKGRMVKVKIEKAFSHSIWGIAIEVEPALNMKGVNYAA